MPIDSDIVIDVRFLPNPNYVKHLRAKTGKDSGVKRYVQTQKLYRIFLNKFSQMLKFLLPNFVKEGKSNLTIAIGCTGGRHRSVVFTEDIAKLLKKLKYSEKIYHRDIDHVI